VDRSSLLALFCDDLIAAIERQAQQILALTERVKKIVGWAFSPPPQRPNARAR
jgi:hypothetical protein